MGKLVIENLNVRIAVFNGGERMVTVKALCRGPGDLCAVARLKPRHHIAPPVDGLWNIDLVSTLKVRGADPSTTREIFFHGEADWCQGVRLHADGVIMEHRLAEHDLAVVARGSGILDADVGVTAATEAVDRTNEREGRAGEFESGLTQVGDGGQLAPGGAPRGPGRARGLRPPRDRGRGAGAAAHGPLAPGLGGPVALVRP